MSLNINPSSLPIGSIGSSYNQQLTLTSSTSGSVSATWTISSGSLPPGLSLSGNGLISGVPSSNGTFSFVVSANTGSLIARRNMSITIQPSTGFGGGSPVLPQGQLGVFYSTQLTPSTSTWTLFPGSTLPPGLTLSSSGLISGTPTATGTFTFTTQVQQGNQTNTQQFTITIIPSQQITIQPQTLPSGSVGSFYSQQLTLSNSNTGTWSVSSGSLPTGLVLSQSGLISGTPQTSGTFPITIQTVPSGSTFTVSQSYMLVIGGGQANIQPSTLSVGTVNMQYQQQLSLSSGSMATWSVSSGSLPPGLSLSSTGLISGTPTLAGGFNFTVQANVNGQVTTQQFSITIRPSPSGGTSIVITSPSTLNSGTVGSSYSQQLNASSPATWITSSGSLPPGLTLSQNGLISGVPSMAGSFSFNATANPMESSLMASSKQFTINVQSSPGGTPGLTITNPSPLPNATQGVNYSQQFAVSPSTSVTWSASGLPSGLSLAMSSGLLSGSPTSTGIFSFNVTATPTSGTGLASTSKMFTMTVDPGNGNGQALTISPTSLPNARAGTSYSQQLSASPSSGTTTWSIVSGGLPAGLTLSSMGLISGTPSRSESASFTVQARNNAGTGTQSLSITVDQDLTPIQPNRFSTFTIIAIIVGIIILIIIIIALVAFFRGGSTGAYTQVVTTGQPCDPTTSTVSQVTTTPTVTSVPTTTTIV